MRAALFKQVPQEINLKETLKVFDNIHSTLYPFLGLSMPLNIKIVDNLQKLDSLEHDTINQLLLYRAIFSLILDFSRLLLIEDKSLNHYKFDVSLSKRAHSLFMKCILSTKSQGPVKKEIFTENL